jgi:putative tryptophan/tyrosine transport system substrate-binding protein
MRRREFIALAAVVATAGSPAALAQTMPTVGVVSSSTASTSTLPAAFRRYLKEFGWEEGRNCRVLFEWTEGHGEKLPGLVGELLAQRASVIVVFGTAAIEAARRATRTTPIVAITNDMVKSGAAASLARPGSNITGVSILASELDMKRLELLHETVPAARRIGVLVDPTQYSTRAQLDDAAHALDLELVEVRARDAEEVPRALDALKSARVDGVILSPSALFQFERRRIIAELNHARLPAIYHWPEMAEDGGLLGYGPRLQVVYRSIVELVAKVLRGARPEDLPIEQPEKLDLVVNLKTARALGIAIPPAILTRADEVIE